MSFSSLRTSQTCKGACAQAKKWVHRWWWLIKLQSHAGALERNKGRLEELRHTTQRQHQQRDFSSFFLRSLHVIWGGWLAFTVSSEEALTKKAPLSATASRLTALPGEGRRGHFAHTCAQRALSWGPPWPELAQGP